jgi:hypothetical protein
MITANGLIKLGFTPEVDFSLQDDGQGAYIKEWISASPQPTEAEIGKQNTTPPNTKEIEPLNTQASKH